VRAVLSSYIIVGYIEIRLVFPFLNKRDFLYRSFLEPLIIFFFNLSEEIFLIFSFFSNFHSFSNPILSRYYNNKSIIVDKTTTNNNFTTKFGSSSSSNCVDVIVDVVDDHLYKETKNNDNLDDYIQIENDGDFIKNKCKQGKEQNGFVVAADGGVGEEIKMEYFFKFLF